MSLYRFLIILFVTACLPAALTIQQIPSFLKICHRNDPDLGECIKQSVNSLKPYLNNGIQVLGIPSCEPFRLEEIDIDQSSGPIYIRSKYNNVSIFGGSNIAPKSIKVDFEKNRIRMKVYIPRLEMIANYNLNGRIMMLPIRGNGLGRGNFTDIDAIIMLQLQRYTNDRTGLVHQRVEDIYVDFNIGHATIQLNNLFDGDETLSAAMNLFLNDNWKIVVAEIRPKLEETIADIVKNFADAIFTVFPEDVLLPP
ncbi:Protein takeout [Anthophora plagiata]